MRGGVQDIDHWIMEGGRVWVVNEVSLGEGGSTNSGGGGCSSLAWQAYIWDKALWTGGGVCRQRVIKGWPTWIVQYSPTQVGLCCGWRPILAFLVCVSHDPGGAAG